MAPLVLELSNLEVEPLEVVVDNSELEQEWSLDTLTSQVDIDALLTGKGVFPVNANCCCVPCLCPCLCCCCC